MVFITLNALFNGFILGIMFQFIGGVLKEPIASTHCVLIGYIISAILTLIGYTNFTSNVLHIFINARKPVGREIKQIEPLLLDIIANVNKNFNTSYNYEEIKIRITDNKIANICVLGYNTIIISVGSLETFSEVQLRAILAHELVKLYYRDSVRTTALVFGSFGTRIVMWLYLLLAIVRVGLGKMAIRFKNGVILNLLLFIPFILLLPIVAINWIGVKAFYLFNRFLSRKAEYQADAFVSYLGYKSDIIEALEVLNHLSVDDNSFMGRLVASKPAIMQRIRMLENNTIQQQYFGLFNSRYGFVNAGVSSNSCYGVLPLIGYLFFVGIAFWLLLIWL